MANQPADALYELICPNDYQMRYSEVPEKQNGKFRN
jgi:hypothetical protein